MSIVLDLFNREVVGWSLKPRMAYGMVCSMSRKGNCWDNAPTESWFGGFKNERVYGERFETRDEVIAMTLVYIEVFYNRKRLHSTLGYKSPMRFLDDRLTAQEQEKLAA